MLRDLSHQMHGLAPRFIEQVYRVKLITGLSFQTSMEETLQVYVARGEEERQKAQDVLFKIKRA